MRAVVAVEVPFHEGTTIGSLAIKGILEDSIGASGLPKGCLGFLEVMVFVKDWDLRADFLGNLPHVGNVRSDLLVFFSDVIEGDRGWLPGRDLL